MGTLTQVLLFTLAPALVAIAGGIAAVYWRPGPRVTSSIQHVAAGVVFSAAATELLPPVMQRSAWVAIVGFAIGVPVMLGLRWATRHLGVKETASALANVGWMNASAGLVATTALDLAVDGLVLGAGFAAGERQGVLLVIALSLELLFLGLSTVVSLAGNGAPNRTAVAVNVGLAAVLIVFAAIGLAVLSRLPSVVTDTVFAFALVALMYLVTEELLVEAHEVPETPWATGAFFLGFLAYLLVVQAIG